MRRADRFAGFTVVEVLAAIALAGVVVSGGALLLGQLDDEANRIANETATVSRYGNGERLFRALLRNAEPSTDTVDRFRGDEYSAAWRSWCERPSGWMERCSASLSIDRRPDSSALLVTLSTGEELVLAVHSGHVELRYLDLLARHSTWVRFWDRTITLPTAIALVRDRDTLVFPLGAARD
jgi:hypothetical protein